MKQTTHTLGQSPHHPHRHHPYRWVVTAVVLALLLYVLAPQFPVLGRSISLLAEASLPYILLALALMVLSYALMAEIYHILIKHPIRYGIMLIVQTATALVSRIAPIGVGTMGFTAYFLRKNKHTTGEGLAVVAAANGISFIVHGLMLAAVLVLTPLPFANDISVSSSTVYWTLSAFGLLILVTALSPKVRHAVQRTGRDLAHTLKGYRRNGKKLWSAAGMSVLLSACYVFCLSACAHAFGVSLDFGQMFLIYTFSLLTGIATPTPGGLVGVEAGITGGLMAYGVTAETALAIALLYRLVTYWLPLVPGFIAFRVAHHRYL